MQRSSALAATATACAAAVLLAACGNANASADAAEDPVYAEMTTWDACEVLDNLAPITEYMDIQGYGTSTGTGGDPGTSQLGNTFDPNAIGCGNLISLGESEGYASGGELIVKIVPTENENQAASAYEERVSTAQRAASQGEGAESAEFAEHWDQGTAVTWLGTAESPYFEVIAQDGQWVLHIELNYDKDFGLQGTGTPSYPFTRDELGQWLVESYLPEVNQIVNDRIAEVAQA